MNPEVALVLRMAAEITGEKLAEGGIGKIARWRRRRMIAHLLASDADLSSKKLKPVIYRLLDAEDLEIHVFRAACTRAARTGSFGRGDDPVQMDGADVSGEVGINTPDLERVLLLLQGRACLEFVRAPVFDPRTLNGVAIRIPRSAVEFVCKLQAELQKPVPGWSRD